MSAGKDGLVPKQVTAYRDGQPYQTTVWVRPEDAGSTGYRLANGGVPAPAVGRVGNEKVVGLEAMVNPNGLAVIADNSDPTSLRWVTSEHLRADGDHAVIDPQLEGDGIVYCGDCNLNVTEDDRHGADIAPGETPNPPERQTGYVLYDRELNSELPAVTYRQRRDSDPAEATWGEQTFVIEDRVNGDPDLGYIVQTANGVDRAAELAHDRQVAGQREDQYQQTLERELRDREDAVARANSDTFRNLTGLTSLDMAYHRQQVDLNNRGERHSIDYLAARSWLNEAEQAGVDLGRQHATRVDLAGWTPELERARYLDRTYEQLPPSVRHSAGIEPRDVDGMDREGRILRAQHQRDAIVGFAESVFRVERTGH